MPGRSGAATGPGGAARPTGGRKGPFAGPGRDGCEGDGMRLGERDWRMSGGLRGGVSMMMRLVFKGRTGGLMATLCWLKKTWVCLVFGSLSCVIPSPSPAQGEQKPIETQIKEIVSSSEGTVRKWTKAIRIVVLFRGDSFRDVIESEIESVRANVPNFPGVQDVTFFDLDTSGKSLFGRASYEVLEDDDGRYGAVTIVGGDTVRHFGAEMFVVVSGLEDGVLFGSLFDKGSLRDFVKGTNRGFYVAFSTDDEFSVANIVINSTTDVEDIDDVFHEEFTQAIGLLNDSQGSDQFSYDNLGGDFSHYENDFRLLRALYSLNVKPGDDPILVVKEYLSSE